MTNKKIFFVCYGGGHSNIIDFITKELRKEKKVKIQILALTIAYPNLKDTYSSEVLFKISDYIHLFDKHIDKILEYGNDLLKDNYNESSGISKFDTICYLGLSMYDLVIKNGLTKAKEIYENKKRQSFLPTIIMEKILTYEKPDLLVSTTSPRFEQASFIAANKLGIETLEILDLFGELYPLPEANNIVVMNESVKNSLINQGLINRKYHILGQPVIENTVLRIKNIDIEKVKLKIPELKNKKVLAFFTQPPIIYNKDFSFKESIDYDFYNHKIFTIFENIIENLDINILIRLHPNEKFSNYEKWNNKYKNIHFTNEILSLEENIAISDVVLTHSSTVSVEAMAVNKKVMTFMHEYDFAYPLPAVSIEPFIFSKTFSELEKKLLSELKRENLISSSFKEFVQYDSSKNIAKLIIELVDNK